MLFTLLTFPLHCTLDIEQCGRGRLFAGPIANEAIKSILPWLSKGQGEQGKSSAVSANTKHLSHPAVRIHNKPCFVIAATPLVVVPSCQCDAQHSWRSQAASGHIYPCAPSRSKWKWKRNTEIKWCLCSTCKVLWSHGGQQLCSVPHYFGITQQRSGCHDFSNPWFHLTFD